MKSLGKSNIIWVNCTRFLSHFVSAIENILNAREAHIESYTAIQNEKGYSRCQKELVGKFKDYLTNSITISFMIFILDVCRLLSVFSRWGGGGVGNDGWLFSSKNIGRPQIFSDG